MAPRQNPRQHLGDRQHPAEIFFDANNNAIAIYCTNNGPGGTLVIAEASAATNWTDWQTAYTTAGTAGGYFSEAQADASELASKGILTVVMQDNPTSSAGPAPSIRWTSTSR